MTSLPESLYGLAFWFDLVGFKNVDSGKRRQVARVIYQKYLSLDAERMIFGIGLLFYLFVS
jgi:hypothetical protein